MTRIIKMQKPVFTVGNTWVTYNKTVEMTFQTKNCFLANLGAKIDKYSVIYLHGHSLTEVLIGL
jgi:hypothetical protein